MNVDNNALGMLMSMGLPELRARKALMNCNNDVDAATGWIFEHMDDPDIDDPLPEENTSNESELTAITDPELHETYVALLSPSYPFIKTPSPQDFVYKDECVASFETAVSTTGLFICLKSFICVSQKFLELHHRKTNQPVYLKRITHRKEIIEEKKSESSAAPTVLGIGVEGGFNDQKKKYEETDHYVLFVYDSKMEIDASDANLPAEVKRAINGVIKAESGKRRQEVAAWTVELKESKYAKDLVQKENGVKVPPKNNQCAKCDLKENLWMNLTDGTILCGRKQATIVGNSHALKYYEETGYPLCVKLGTITPEGADVYSYKEDDMVLDPLLNEHLSHFGINMQTSTKTEKSMADYDLDLNIKHEWNAITEDGQDLVNCYGPGYTGIKNLGNTCYMASVLQTLFMVPSFVSTYFDNYNKIVEENIDQDPVNNFQLQMSKLAYGLCSGEYSKKLEDGNEDELGIRPTMFKSLIGKGHAEFATNRQQDASEFYQYLMEFINRKKRNFNVDPSDVFRFEVEEKLTCGDSGKVRIQKRSENMLSLAIPTDLAVNKEEVGEYNKKVESGDKVAEKVALTVPFHACVAQYGADMQLSDWLSPASNKKTTAKKIQRLATFPEYLFVHAERFYLDESWSPKKLDVNLDVPDTYDFSFLRAKGLCDGELELEDGQNASAEGKEEWDNSVVGELMAAGFPENASKRASMLNKNTGLQGAMDWCLMNIDSPEFNAPITLTSAPTELALNEEDIAMVMSMGFDPNQARKALKATNGDVNRAVEWIFSHADELDNMSIDEESTSETIKNEDEKLSDSENGQYKLIGFISHMGASTQVGHYVCHLLKEKDQFTLFNDEKVAISKKPPKPYGYMYLFQRSDTL